MTTLIIHRRGDKNSKQMQIVLPLFLGFGWKISIGGKFSGEFSNSLPIPMPPSSPSSHVRRTVHPSTSSIRVSLPNLPDPSIRAHPTLLITSPSLLPPNTSTFPVIEAQPSIKPPSLLKSYGPKFPNSLHVIDPRPFNLSFSRLDF